MAASTPEELAVKRITVYFDTGQETLATNMVIPMGYLGGQPNRPGP